MDEGIPEESGSGKEESSIVGSVLPLTQAVTFGGISGFCSGFVLKKLGKAAAATFGTLFVLSQVASLHSLSFKFFLVCSSQVSLAC